MTSRRVMAALNSLDVGEARRPGIGALCDLVKKEHPKWNNSEIAARAKVLWTSKEINREREDGTVETVANEHYRGASVRTVKG